MRSVDAGGWLRAFLPLLVWTALVWLVGGMAEVPVTLDETRGLDKLGHLVLYGVLGFLCGRAWRALGGGAGAAAVLIVLALVLGAADELRQVELPGRSGSVADWIADAAGVLVGFVIAASWARQRQRT